MKFHAYSYNYTENINIRNYSKQLYLILMSIKGKKGPRSVASSQGEVRYSLSKKEFMKIGIQCLRTTSIE